MRKYLLVFQSSSFMNDEFAVTNWSATMVIEATTENISKKIKEATLDIQKENVSTNDAVVLHQVLPL